RASTSPADDQRRRSHLTSPPLRLKMLAMAQQPPPSNVGQVSGDGRWRWDGHQWVPNTPVLAGGGYMVPAQPGALVVAPKNPAVSLIVSFFLPGVGSMINGDTNRGIPILALKGRGRPSFGRVPPGGRTAALGSRVRRPTCRRCPPRSAYPPRTSPGFARRRSTARPCSRSLRWSPARRLPRRPSPVLNP